MSILDDRIKHAYGEIRRGFEEIAEGRIQLHGNIEMFDHLRQLEITASRGDKLATWNGRRSASWRGPAYTGDFSIYSVAGREAAENILAQLGLRR